MKSDKQERIMALLILILSFLIPLPLLGIISGAFLLRQAQNNRLPVGFKWGAYVLFFEQIIIYIPIIVYFLMN